MTFTDDDLERLKEYLLRKNMNPGNVDKSIEALITRLEVAEACASEAMELLTDNPSYVYSDVRSYMAWRKAAGK